jgi:hypothetical protein
MATTAKTAWEKIVHQNGKQSRPAQSPTYNGVIGSDGPKGGKMGLRDCLVVRQEAGRLLRVLTAGEAAVGRPLTRKVVQGLYKIPTLANIKTNGP